MKYKVVIHKRAVRYLKKLDEHRREQIQRSLQELESGISESSDYKSMLGEWKGYYRQRIGDIRIIFWRDDELMTFYVDYIGSRGDIYKKK